MQNDFAITIDKKPVKNFWKGRGGFLPIAIVERMIQGSIEDAELYFDGRGPDGVFAVSAHYAVARDGRVWQFVADEDTAWSNGVLQNPDLSIGWLQEVYQEKVNCNLVTLSIDYEGFSGEPLTPEQYRAALALHRQLVKRWEIDADAQHIIGQNWIDSLERSHNPGLAFPFEQLLKDLQAPPSATLYEREMGLFNMPAPAALDPVVETEEIVAYQPEAVEEPAYRPQIDAFTFAPELNHEMNPATAEPQEVDLTNNASPEVAPVEINQDGTALEEPARFEPIDQAPAEAAEVSPAETEEIAEPAFEAEEAAQAAEPDEVVQGTAAGETDQPEQLGTVYAAASEDDTAYLSDDRAGEQANFAVTAPDQAGPEEAAPDATEGATESLSEEAAGTQPDTSGEPAEASAEGAVEVPDAIGDEITPQEFPAEVMAAQAPDEPVSMAEIFDENASRDADRPDQNQDQEAAAAQAGESENGLEVTGASTGEAAFEAVSVDEEAAEEAAPVGEAPVAEEAEPVDKDVAVEAAPVPGEAESQAEPVSEEAAVETSPVDEDAAVEAGPVAGEAATDTGDSAAEVLQEAPVEAETPVEEVPEEAHETPASQPEQDSFYPFEIDTPAVPQHRVYYSAETATEPASQADGFDFDTIAPATPFSTGQESPTNYPFELPYEEARLAPIQASAPAEASDYLEFLKDSGASREQDAEAATEAATQEQEFETAHEVTEVTAAREPEAAGEALAAVESPETEVDVQPAYFAAERRQAVTDRLSEAATVAPEEPPNFGSGELALPDWLEAPEAELHPPGQSPSERTIRPAGTGFSWGATVFPQETSLPGWLQKPAEAVPAPVPEPVELPPTSNPGSRNVPAVTLPNSDWQESIFDDEDFFTLLNQAGLDARAAGYTPAGSSEADSEDGPLEPSEENVSNFERLLSQSGASQPPLVPAAPARSESNAEPDIDNLFEEVPPPAKLTPRQLIDRNDGYTAPLSYEDLDLSMPFDLDDALTTPDEKSSQHQAPARPGMSFDDTFLASAPPPAWLNAAAPASADDSNQESYNRANLGGGIISVELANIRSIPSYDKETILKVAESGDRFEFDGWAEGPELRSSTRWYHISARSGGGWVHSTLVRLDRPFNA